MGYEVVMSGGNTADQVDKILDEMKSEHEQLFQTVDRIRDALSAEDMSVAKHHLIKLQIYQQSHFDHELGLMEQYEYPHSNDHKKTHGNLIEALRSINKLINLENLQRLNGELADYLDNSLKHVIEVDRPFQEFLSASRDLDA